MLSGEVTRASISIHPAHRAHSRASFTNTGQIREAHGNRLGRGVSPAFIIRLADSLVVSPSSFLSGTIWALAANAGAGTPRW